MKHRYRYGYLLLALSLLLLLAPFIEKLNRYFPFFPLLFMTVIVLALKATYSRKWILITGIVLSLAAFLLEFLPGVSFLEKGGEVPQLFTLFLYTLFTGASIVALGRRILSEPTVDTNTVWGGISVYLLIGVLWMLLYLAIMTFEPGALSIPADQKNLGHTLLYYSFTTLTTVGYGDIVPRNKLAMTLSNLEAIVGQLYLAVFISRLVGLQIAHEITKKRLG